MSVTVELAERLLALPSLPPPAVLARTRELILDMPTYENWEGKGANWPHIPDTHHYNLSDYYESFVKMEATGAQVLPSHDFRIFEKPIYG